LREIGRFWEEPVVSLEIGEWPVAIADAGVSSKTARYLILPSGWSLSTSGTGEQFFRTPDGRMLSHIIDPRTGWPIAGTRSVTVMARSGLASEALAKSLLLLEASEKEDFLRSVDGDNWIFAQDAHESAAAALKERKYA